MILTGEVKTLLVAMTPFFELRGSIPLALTVYNLPVWSSYLFSVIGNLIPVVFILWLLGAVSEFLSRHFSFFKRFFEWLFERTKSRHEKKFEKWKSLALVLLVAIPLPFTGAWTGSLAAFVFGIPVKKAFPLIALGVLLAGLIVILSTLGIIEIL
ncbi:MAG: small multi-drug export protein [Candidatus Paceibacterota bacterium]|jgi:uncharacterized membrane protein|nr:small multi-drug export protein [Candidatus Paceibacterota bacterium]